MQRGVSVFIHPAIPIIRGVCGGILGAASSVIVGKKNTPFVQRHTKALILGVNGCIVAADAAIAILNRSWLDVFSIIGVVLHTDAFWISDEKTIRRVSLLGSPFWFVYNFFSRAYGSAAGDVLTMCSIGIAIVRYRNTEKMR